MVPVTPVKYCRQPSPGLRESDGLIKERLWHLLYLALLVQAAAGVVGGLDLVRPRRDRRAEGERDRARRARRPRAKVHCKTFLADRDSTLQTRGLITYPNNQHNKQPR